MLAIEITAKHTTPQVPRAANQETNFEWAPLPFRGCVVGPVIGRGCSSIVFEAEHPRYGKVALKQLDRSYAYNHTQEVEFIKQASGHENVLSLIDTWFESGHWYIMMERMDGTLLDLIEQQMDKSEIQNAYRQMVEGLVHIHTNGIVHFDMKPENVGYKIQDGRIVYKIMDFGIAEWTEEVSKDAFQEEVQDGSCVKTSGWYRSPECNRLSKRRVSEDSDTWSLGCILYEMIKGGPLFHNHDSDSTLTIQSKLDMALKKIQGDHKIGRNTWFNIELQLCLVFRFSSFELKDNL
jgi:serine/threonine protein kinase